MTFLHQKSMVAWAQDLVENTTVSELQSMVAWIQVLAENSIEVRIKVIIKKIHCYSTEKQAGLGEGTIKSA